METPTYFDPVIEAKVEARIKARDTVDKNHPAWVNTYKISKDDADIPWDMGVERWVAGCEQVVEFVPRNEEAGLYEPLDGDFRASNSVVNVPLNMVGQYFSRNETFKGHVKNAVFDVYRESNPELIDLIALLESKGYKSPMEIVMTGVENMPDALARLYFDGEESILVGNKDISRLSRELAEEYGISEKEAEGLAIVYIIRDHIYHELVHNQGVVKGYAEREVGEILAEFWGKKAEKSGLFAKLAEINSDYAKRYASKYSGSVALAEKYFREALARGYTDEEEIADYVAGRLEDHVSDKKSGLEDKVDKEDSDSESKEGASREYKGRKSESEPEEDTDGDKAAQDKGENPDSEQSQDDGEAAAEDGGDAGE